MSTKRPALAFPVEVDGIQITGAAYGHSLSIGQSFEETAALTGDRLNLAKFVFVYIDRLSRSLQPILAELRQDEHEFQDLLGMVAMDRELWKR